jgi:hypothetical protein
MTWYTGTATDFKDLLLAIHDNAVAEGWTSERYTTGGSTPHTDELILQGPGFGAGYEVYFGLRTYEDAPNNHYCFEARGYTAFDSTRLFDMQLNVSPMTVMRLWNATINYWMSISDRRIVVVAKCSNSYHSLYAGFINAFSDPIEFPYPFYLGTDAPSYGAFGAVDNFAQSMASPGLGGAYFRDPSGNWRAVAVRSDGSFGYEGFSGSRYTMWPYLAPGNNGVSSAQWRYPPFDQFEALPGTVDTLPMMNIYLFAMFDKGGVPGVLEGVYWVPGNGISAEQVLTVGAADYQVFINISRSVESPTSFYAVKEA